MSEGAIVTLVCSIIAAISGLGCTLIVARSKKTIEKTDKAVADHGTQISEIHVMVNSQRDAMIEKLDGQTECIRVQGKQLTEALDLIGRLETRLGRHEGGEI